MEFVVKGMQSAVRVTAKYTIFQPDGNNELRICPHRARIRPKIPGCRQDIRAKRRVWKRRSVSQVPQIAAKEEGARLACGARRLSPEMRCLRNPGVPRHPRLPRAQRRSVLTYISLWARVREARLETPLGFSGAADRGERGGRTPGVRRPTIEPRDAVPEEASYILVGAETPIRLRTRSRTERTASQAARRARVTSGSTGRPSLGRT